MASKSAIISALLGYSAEMVSADRLRYHPAVRANRRSRREVNHSAIIVLEHTWNFIRSSMEIRFEKSKVAANVTDTEMQLETCVTALERYCGKETLSHPSTEEVSEYFWEGLLIHQLLSWTV